MSDTDARAKLNEQTRELRKSINTFVTGQGAKNPFLQNNPFSPKNQKPAEQISTPAISLLAALERALIEAQAAAQALLAAWKEPSR